MKSLIDLCIRRPVSVIMFLAALLLAGIFSISVLPVQRLPEFPFPRVTVETLYPGLGAEDIRQMVTIPVEDALSSVKGLERMRSVSRDGASLTVLDFRWGTDSGAASVLVREAIDAVYPSLPEGALKPAVIPGDPDEQAQLIVTVRSPLGPVFARNLAEYELRSLFRRVDGVGTVLLSGGEREELAIKVDLPRALSRALPLSTLAEIFSAETVNIPAGNARDGDKELVVVSQGKPCTEAELSRLIFPSQNGAFVIGDIGSLERTTAKKESIFIVSGKNKSSDKDEYGTSEFTALEIFRRPGADPVKLSRDLQKAITEASNAFSRDAEIKIIYDDAASIVPEIRQLFVSVILGTAAVMIVLFFNLKSFRYSLLAGLSLPLSLAASVSVLAVLGKTLNNMSLSGIALGVGLVSDTSVIILDLLHNGFDKKERPGCNELGTLAASVAASSFGGTATTAVVFVPVMFLPGPLGSLFGDLSVSLVVSILTGWIYAQFALPSLFRMFFPARKSTANSGKEMAKKGGKYHPDDFVINRYAPLLKSCVQKPGRILVITIFLCTAGFALLFTRPFGFISAGTATEIEVVLNFPPGTVMEKIADEASVLGDQLESLSGINLVFGRAGSEKEDTARRSDPDYRSESFVFCCVLGSKQKPITVLASINSLLEKQNYECFARFPRDKTEKLLGLSSSAVMAVKGRNREEAESRAALAEDLIHRKGFVAARRPSGSRSEIRVVPDREASAYAGISTAETAMALYAAAEGLELGELELEGKPLTMKLSASAMPEPELMPITFRDSRPVFAGSINSFVPRKTPAALARLDRSDTIYLEAYLQSGTIRRTNENEQEFVQFSSGKEKDLSAALSSICSEGKEQGFVRADESAFARYRSSLILTVILVLILLYLTMGVEFESFSLPLVLFPAIPFSLAGSGPALFLSGAGLDSSSVLSLMVLFGLSVNNGMILYELAAEKYKQGKTAAESVYEAALERVRPVITTALTTVFALLPLVINPLGVKEHSMAAAMLGGIMACTALTLFAMPPVFIRFLQKQSRKM
ncbi:MAG: efflux RND transporter permease subunit [Treponema sp.]|nr:efflux RND transporter permease subunit [Treponema sp.]